MSIVDRRYRFRGPDLAALEALTDPGLVLKAPKFFIAFDVEWDDAICEIPGMDAAMAEFGCEPDGLSTTAADPFIGPVSPDGSVWALSVSDLGVLSLTKVKVTP